MTFSDHYEFRRALVEQLELDLIGPTGRDNSETITDSPITKYATGILYPQSTTAIDEESSMDDEGESRHVTAESTPDPAVTMSNVRYPSSMGLTFAVDTRIAQAVTVSVEAARYVQESGGERVRRRSSDTDDELWRRLPIPVEPVTLQADEPGQTRTSIADNLELFTKVRTTDGRDIVAITVALINKAEIPAGTGRDSAAFFQPRITLSSSTGTAPFVERTAPGTPDGDEELDSYRLLYRHAPTFATGHGCAVEWDHTPGEINEVSSTGTARSIRTTFVPSHDLLLADSNPKVDTEKLGMRDLAKASESEIHTVLHNLISGYRQWIEQRREDTDRLVEPDLRAIALSHLDTCVTACDRMATGVGALTGPALEAFRLANLAMATQRARTDWLKAGRPTVEPDETTGKWRPFQIAFILLTLGGIADKKSPDREIADVLWFPTGGGKTEAYLGLIAFSVFLRRLRDPHNGGGVTVLMRYTLRLLTVQQFERAALLICAMERLRLDDLARLGKNDVISIGMWVGQGSTPNDLTDAKTALRKLSKKELVEENNPVQLRSCPWCGTAMDHRNYRIIGADLVIACGAPDCDFRNGLPVHVVDETIYAHRPTLIIATADKFASIPWKSQIAALFNQTTTEPPPELIIQDELHLISGPLGTLAGLYETAVDLAAEHPKVVASTATIRRAIKQGKALFDRKVSQFPPPGLDARDSYFSVESPPTTKATRLYVGVMAPATSQTTLLVRAYAALLHYGNVLEGSDKVRDPYWTLLGYFNSLRLLAGAKLQLQDDVTKRLGLLAGQNGGKERTIDWPIELTSREPSSAIPEHLKDMTRALPAEAIDVILATNMISVGVDVDRLGLMVVMGQPQSTSEYIQATSRVGRSWPGLVVTLFNSARSRDRSHYENFTAYHSALYRQVEATSVTPFSARARDRGLHAVVVGLARLLIPEARPKEGASLIRDFEPQLRALCVKILKRVEKIAGSAERAASEKQIDEILDQWKRRADDEPDLVYDDFNHPGNGLLMDAGRYDESNDEISDTMPTLWSLRDVDVESKLYLEGKLR